MQVHFLGITNDQWQDWLERFIEILRERNNIYEVEELGNQRYLGNQDAIERRQNRDQNRLEG